MRPGGRSAGLAAAWALLASGCDYWENLTRTKEVAQADLVLSLRDAWTGDPLPRATCSLEGAEPVAAGSDGTIAFPRLATGKQSLACASLFYHDRKVDLEIPAGPGSRTIKLARKGGVDWYPEDPSRQVRIERHGGNLLFPGRMMVRGFPADTADPWFRYAWTSTRHTSLPGWRSVPLDIRSAVGDRIDMTLTLTVTAILAERIYEVGSDSQTFHLARNQPPHLLVGASVEGPIRVGTGCEDQFLNLVYTAADGDGDSCSVRLTAQQPHTPFGRLDTLVACGQSKVVTLPLEHHDGFPDESLVREGELLVQARDENEGSRDTVISATTFSNLPPLVTLVQLDARESNFANEVLRFRLFAKDRDQGKMKALEVDWMDGERKSYAPTFLMDHDSLDREISHEFARAGTYLVEAAVTDGCGAIHKASLPVVAVENRQPKVSVKPVGYHRASGEYRIQVEASDEDVLSGLDSIHVLVEWGDPSIPDQIAGKPFEHIQRVLGHVYMPEPGEKEFYILVTAGDRYDGNAFDTLVVNVSALGGP